MKPPLNHHFLMVFLAISGNPLEFLWILRIGGSLSPRRPLFSTEGIERAEYGHGNGATWAECLFISILVLRSRADFWRADILVLSISLFFRLWADSLFVVPNCSLVGFLGDRGEIGLIYNQNLICRRVGCLEVKGFSCVPLHTTHCIFGVAFVLVNRYKQWPWKLHRIDPHWCLVCSLGTGWCCH